MKLCNEDSDMDRIEENTSGRKDSSGLDVEHQAKIQTRAGSSKSKEKLTLSTQHVDERKNR